MPSNHTFNPDNILHALKHCQSQELGAYLGVCNKTDCHRSIEHGEPVNVHAYYSECSNGWHITSLHCRDHNPDTTFDTNHSHTTAIVTAIFNYPTTIPPRNHPILSDFRFIKTTAELPQLPEPADPNPGESKYVVSPENLKNGDYTTLEDLLKDISESNEQTTLEDWDNPERDADAVTEPGNTLHDWFENENPREYSFTDLLKEEDEENQLKSLTEDELDDPENRDKKS